MASNQPAPSLSKGKYKVQKIRMQKLRKGAGKRKLKKKSGKQRLMKVSGQEKF